MANLIQETILTVKFMEKAFIGGQRENNIKVVSLQIKGHWDSQKRNGVGKNIYPNGDIYEGEWVNDKKHGKGKLIKADGKVI